MKIVVSILLSAVILSSSTSKADDAAVLTEYITNNSNQPSIQLVKTNLVSEYLLNKSDIKELKKLLPSLELISHKGTQADFFKTIKVKGRLENIKNPTATVELTATW